MIARNWFSDGVADDVLTAQYDVSCTDDVSQILKWIIFFKAPLNTRYPEKKLDKD